MLLLFVLAFPLACFSYGPQGASQDVSQALPQDQDLGSPSQDQDLGSPSLASINQLLHQLKRKVKTLEHRIEQVEREKAAHPLDGRTCCCTLEGGHGHDHHDMAASAGVGEAHHFHDAEHQHHHEDGLHDGGVRHSGEAFDHHGDESLHHPHYHSHDDALHSGHTHVADAAVHTSGHSPYPQRRHNQSAESGQGHLQHEERGRGGSNSSHWNYHYHRAAHHHGGSSEEQGAHHHEAGHVHGNSHEEDHHHEESHVHGHSHDEDHHHGGSHEHGHSHEEEPQHTGGGGHDHSHEGGSSEEDRRATVQRTPRIDARRGNATVVQSHSYQRRYYHGSHPNVANVTTAWVSTRVNGTSTVGHHVNTTANQSDSQGHFPHHHHHHVGVDHYHHKPYYPRGRKATYFKHGNHFHLIPQINYESADYYWATCDVIPSRSIPQQDQQNVTGRINLWQHRNGGYLHFHVNLTGFRVDHATDEHQHLHGFHAHETPDLSEGCDRTGPHFNPLNTSHGAPDSTVRHVGDFGNIKCDDQGNVHLNLLDNQASLIPGRFSIMGRPLVIHANRDDLGVNPNDEGSRTTGNSGPRIACCVVTQVDRLPDSPNLRPYDRNRYPPRPDAYVPSSRPRPPPTPGLQIEQNLAPQQQGLM